MNILLSYAFIGHDFPSCISVLKHRKCLTCGSFSSWLSGFSEVGAPCLRRIDDKTSLHNDRALKFSVTHNRATLIRVLFGLFA